MSRERERHIEEVFLAAAGCEDAAERERIVHAGCAGDAGLEAEVRSLLGGHENAGGVLDRLPPAPLGLSVSDIERAGPAEGVLAEGTRIAGYTIRRLLGAGGMGEVYAADQERPRRQVAIKLIRDGLSGPSMLRRFEAEAEILGRLHHPGIAQVFEAGRSEGRPFLAMELVEGQPITQFAEQHGLSPSQRVELLARVCEAVQHAHQRGVIHRDIKPSNILVDAAGHPKVLDFGVARVLDADARVTTLGTGLGQLIGTLPYMSPEQVAGDPDGVDTRSDVYALGVVLYQLLTGRLPHELDSRSLPEAARIIRDEPPSRLSSISRTFRGDIDTIVGKAMDKQKERRYQSASELGEDLRRYLAGEPIAARRDSLGYVLNKRLRRYRAIAAVSAASTLAVAGLGVYAAFKAADASRSAAELAVQLSEARIERARLMAGSEQTSLGEAAIWDQLIEHPDSRLARWALWDVYSRSPCLATVPDFEAACLDAAFSADGRMCAVANRIPGCVEVWEGDLSARRHSLSVGTERAYAVAFHPTEPLLATANSAGAVSLWRLDTAARVAESSEHKGWVGALAFSSDGRLLVSGGQDGLLRLWDGSTLAPIRSLEGHTSHILRAAFRPGGSELASSSNDRTVRVWNARTGETRGTLTDAAAQASRSVFSVAYSPDGRTLVVGGLENWLRFHDADTLEVRRSVPLPLFVVAGLAFSPDSSVLYLSHESIEARSAADGSLLRTIVYPDATRRSMALAPDGSRLLTAAARGRVSLWETRLDGAATRLPQAGFMVFDARFTPDGRHLLTPGPYGTLELRAAGTWQVVRTLDAPSPMPVRSLAVSPDSRLAAAGGLDGRVRLWEVASGRLVAETLGHTLADGKGVGVPAAAFSPDGRVLATLGAEQAVRLWGGDTLTLAAALDLRDPVAGGSRGMFGLAWMPDGRSLAIATGGETSVTVWDTAGSTTRRLGNTRNAQNAIQADSAGRAVLLGGAQEITVLDATSGEVRRELSGHSLNIVAMEVLPGGLLATVARDRTLRLWDWPGGTSMLVRSLEGVPTSLSASPDGRYLCCGMQNPSGVVVIDLWYYRRHIAGNAMWHMNRHEPPLSAAARQRVLGSLDPVAPVPASIP